MPRDKRGIRGYWRGKPKQNGFWYPGRLEAETTCDLPDPHRFKVQGCRIDYIIGRQYEDFIRQSRKCRRWKELAVKWLNSIGWECHIDDVCPVPVSREQDTHGQIYFL